MKKIKITFLAIMVISLTNCSTTSTVNSHGLHGTKYIYHPDHYKMSHINSNGLHK